MDKEDGKSVWVEAVEHPVYNYTAPGGVLKKTEVGSFSQIPLKVCAAMTIHKSQGKTFDAEVLTPSIFAPGQLYVALSRVRGPEGLFLTQEISESALIPDPIVAEFTSAGYSWPHEQEKPKVTATKRKTTKTKIPRTTKTKKTTKKSSKKPATAKKSPTKKPASKTAGSSAKSRTPAKSRKASTTKKRTSAKSSRPSTIKKRASTSTKRPTPKKGR